MVLLYGLITRSEVDFSIQDPRWIGAWWLGFIVFSIGTIVTALPMICFPRRLKNKTDPVETTIKKQNKSVYYSRKERVKERLLSYWRVLTTPIYVSLIFINCILGFPWIGYWSFISKYITTQFGTPLWKGNMILGHLCLR
ncbi:hypothetical protein KUTeg_000306 [Tegillarca granosa]|uniref:Uncharacterized protein n=1 Tax=Tegillarca granosa TaxID=220873 RepID=A0ABQ9FZX7_TEGGR|nr:hypothetical protein KUTeg_000306 [Tegillarca granosa]